MNCIDLDPLIYPYLDGELDETERGDLESHAAACPGCRVRLSREAAFQGALRRSAQLRTRAPAPEALRAMLRAGIRRENRRVQMISWARWGGLAIAAATAGVIYLDLRPWHREQLLEDAAARYQRRLPFEVTTASRADVERWVGDQMSTRVALPHVAGATIAGARLSNLREHDAAYVVYQLSSSEQRGPERRLGLFVVEDPELRAASEGALEGRLTRQPGTTGRAGCRVVLEMPALRLVELAVQVRIDERVEFWAGHGRPHGPRADV